MPRRSRHPPEIAGRAGTLVQLSTRVPRSLRQRMRVVCVEQDREVQDFIASAIAEKLPREKRGRRRARRRGA